jgi:hypothetical protein
MGSDITNALGMKKDKRSPQQKAEIEAANAMKPVGFSTPHGSQGVTNPNYAEYVKKHPDLMANYNLHWKAGAPQPLSGNNEGISLAEYGAMHWNSAGRAEGRTMPGVSGGGGEVGYGGGGGGGGGDVPGPTNSAGQPIGPYPFENVFFPQLTQAYERPEGNDYRDLFASYGFTGPLAQMEGAYTPGTVQGAALVPGGILEYNPPQLNVGVPRFAPNVTGMLDFGVPGIPEEWLEYLGTADEEDKKKVEAPEK